MSSFGPTRTASAARLDLLEKYVFAAFFAFFAWRMVEAYAVTGSLVTILYMVDQLVVMVFILLRRPPKELSLRVDDWAVGLAGTLLAVLIGPPDVAAALAPEWVVLTLLMAGFAIHFWAKLELRRSFGVVAANRGVKATGPYRLVRHPMYLGYVVSQVGLLLAGPTLANGVIVGALWILYVGRILAEERLLKRDPDYAALCERTRWRLLPGVF